MQVGLIYPSKQSAVFSAALLVSSFALAAPRITDVQLSPSQVNVGDYVHVYFEVSDAGAPQSGSGSVEIGTRRVCKSVATPIAGRHVCAFAIPHGGVFAYTIRFTPSNGTSLESLQTQTVGDLQLVKAKPAISAAGRASLFFVKLDYFDPGSRIQPTGNIVIETLNGSHQCTITLPALTHCALLLPVAGTYSLRARYSGDANFPALTSSIFLHTVANPLRAQPVYLSQAPVLQSSPKLSDEIYSPLGSADRYGRRSVGGGTGTVDYFVGTRIPAYGNIPSSPVVQSDGALAAVFDFKSDSTSIVTLRGQRIAAERNGQLQVFNDKLLSLTGQRLASGDNNEANDLYLRGNNFVNEWLSVKADGSAAANGISVFTAGLDKVAFISAENGFSADDNDELADLFVVTPGALPPAQRIRRYPLTAGFESVRTIVLDENDQQILLRGNNLSVLDLTTGAIRELTNGANQAWRNGIFAPNGAALFQQSEPPSIVYVPRGGSPQIVLVEQDPEVGELSKVLDTGDAMLLGLTTQRRVNLSTGASTLLFNDYAGDERLVRADSLSLNADGSRLAITGADGNFIQVGGANGTRIAIPSSAKNAKLDPAGENVAFESTDASLVPGDTNGVSDVFIQNLRTGLVRRLSQMPGGGQANVRTFLSALGIRYAVTSVTKPDTQGSLPLIGAFSPMLIELASNTGTALLPPEAELMGFVPSTDASAGIWVSRDRRRAYRQLTAPISAPVLISALPTADLFAYNSAAISSGGNIGAFSIGRNSPQPWQDWLVDFNANTARVIKERPLNDRVTAEYTIARNGEVSIRRDIRVNSGAEFQIFETSAHWIVDLFRDTEERLPLNLSLNRFSAAPSTTGAIALSDSGNTIAWASQIQGQLPVIGLTLQRTPFAGTQTYTAISRVQPTQLFAGQSYLAEAVVSHKAPDGAPSGVIRFDDGFGNQCDASLQAQGNLAIGRCNLRSTITQTPAPASQILSATYLGDTQFAQSTSSRAVTINPVGAERLRLSAHMLSRAKVRVTPEFLPNQNVPLRGIVRVVLNSGSLTLSGQQFCDLNAAQLAASASCDFSIDDPEQLTRAFVSIIDDAYAAASTSVRVDLREQLLTNGFE